MVYSPTFTIQINHLLIGKYTVHPMDPSWVVLTPPGHKFLMPWLPLVDWQQLHLVGLESPPTKAPRKSSTQYKTSWVVSTPLKNMSQNGNLPQFSGRKYKIFKTTTQKTWRKYFQKSNSRIMKMFKTHSKLLPIYRLDMTWVLQKICVDR